MGKELLHQFKLLREYTNKLGSFWFYEGFVWAEMNKGIHLKMEDAKEIVELGHKYYRDTGCIYVSNRLNSYSTEITDFIPLERLPFLEGFVMICHSRKSAVVAEVEKLFFKKPFNIFFTIEEAIEWLKQKKPSIP